MRIASLLLPLSLILPVPSIAQSANRAGQEALVLAVRDAAPPASLGPRS